MNTTLSIEQERAIPDEISWDLLASDHEMDRHGLPEFVLDGSAGMLQLSIVMGGKLTAAQ